MVPENPEIFEVSENPKPSDTLKVPELWRVQALDAHDTSTTIFLTKSKAEACVEELEDHGYTWITLEKSKGLDPQTGAILFE
jgi:hypothetical protein